ncbi:HAD family hydrolase [Taibaiella soli]|uniref:HAD family phosphatase n=1 Tax=Taibaiella soli TaxID=1649169 RepID=A0A2W2AYC4_9BACT|nr:HAD family hydrolase [Taibaiella soli]PZF72688.1 HAD family phosphatase [Taibaiella soli]
MNGPIKTLFLDIGNVVLSNGWGHEFLPPAAAHFNIDRGELETRHASVFDNYEIGQATLDDYLDLAVFNEPRSFTKKDFTNFMFAQSVALPHHLDFFLALKRRLNVKVFAVSNEGREIHEYRVAKFGLDDLFDGYISSCYVGLHKPCREILRLACDIAHTAPDQGLYIDDRKELVEMATMFGLQALWFQGLDQTKDFLDAYFKKHR